MKGWHRTRTYSALHLVGLRRYSQVVTATDSNNSVSVPLWGRRFKSCWRRCSFWYLRYDHTRWQLYRVQSSVINITSSIQAEWKICARCVPDFYLVILTNMHFNWKCTEQDEREDHRISFKCIRSYPTWSDRCRRSSVNARGVEVYVDSSNGRWPVICERVWATTKEEPNEGHY